MTAPVLAVAPAPESPELIQPHAVSDRSQPSPLGQIASELEDARAALPGNDIVSSVETGELRPGDPAPSGVPEGRTPMGQFSEEDVFVVSYPKSGATWFQSLAAGVYYGVLPEFGPPLLVHRELVPDIYATKHYRRYSTPMLFKSHQLPQPEYRKVVYLLRDGRDAMVSYYHFNLALQLSVDFLNMVRQGTHLVVGKWHEHVEAWLANPFQAQMIVIKYEDLKQDPVKELERFCAFLGIERERSFLELIARSAHFDKMRRREEKVGWGVEIPQWSKGRFFIRRGTVGSYKDEMPPEVLTAFLQDAAPTLRKTGYL